MKLQIKGLTAVGIILAAAAVVFAIFIENMVATNMMGASTRYKPTFPAIPTTDITKAPQCAEGYEKPWVGCQRLAQ